MPTLDDWTLKNELLDLMHSQRANDLKREELTRKMAGHIEATAHDRADHLTAMRQIAANGLRGACLELSQERARQFGTIGDPYHYHCRLTDLPAFAQRMVMQVGTGSMGGYAVGTAAELVPLNVAPSVLNAAGAQIFVVQGGHRGFARWTTPPTVAYQGEVGTSTAASPVLALASAIPHKMIVTCDASNQLLIQNPLAAAGIFETFQQQFVAQLDAAALSGTGSGPLGVAYWGSALGTAVTGTSLSYSVVQDLIGKALDGNAQESALRAIAATNARTVAAKRAVGTSGDTTLWPVPGRFCGMPAAASLGALSSSLVIGDWSGVGIVLWGDVEFSSDPYSQGMSGISTLKGVIHADVVQLRPKQLCLGTGIT